MDQLGLGPDAGERRVLDPVGERLADDAAHHQLEREADVVAPVGCGQPRTRAAHHPVDDGAHVAAGADLLLDGGELGVALAVLVDDRLQQLRPAAEVVVERRTRSAAPPAR